MQLLLSIIVLHLPYWQRKIFAEEQIRQLILQNDITSVADIYSLLKEGFKDISQEPMEAELDVSIGYEKHKKANWKG